MDDCYSEVTEWVFRLKDHRDGLIRRTIMTFLPILAEYNSSEFFVYWLDKSMTYLLLQLKKQSDRSTGTNLRLILYLQ